MVLTPFLLSQILVGFAFVTDIASFQIKKREITLTLLGISAALISAHFFLLGEPTAGALLGISVVRYAISIFSTRKIFLYILLTAVLLAGIYTFNGFEDVLSITALLLATYAAFQPNEKLLRRIMMVTTSLFIVHNLILWTPVGILLEIFFLSSNIVSYYRFYIKK